MALGYTREAWKGNVCMYIPERLQEVVSALNMMLTYVRYNTSNFLLIDLDYA